MSEFWESSFQDKQTMWGFKPVDSAISTAKLFQKKRLKKILVPGFGYGRNAKIFIDHGMDVTGIEISKTAIELAHKHYGNSLKIYHGNASEIPFDETLYDGVFCYALIHLLDKQERSKLIKNCYSQLKPGGYMVFVAISTSDSSYGNGEQLAGNQFLTPHGVTLFFYEPASIYTEFGSYGLLEAKEITEFANNKASKEFWQIICKKTVQAI